MIAPDREGAAVETWLAGHNNGWRTGYEWPPLARAIEAETSPIRDDLAVETFVESIERWGVEADVRLWVAR